jgi:poly-beta-1,6-N-acetyl-D-glucosamine synthase
MWNPPGTTPHDTRIMIVDSAGALETRESILSEPALQTNTDRAVGLECSVGVMAYNEEANIAQALESILGQDLTAGRIAEAIVVASGCEDRTAEIVAEIAAHDRRVRLIEQPCREGKASAINLFLAAARSPVLLMVSADVIVKEGTIDSLLRHFSDPTVGMVGGHPTPVNSEASFLGHAVHLQWRLHDRIARDSPKLGEIVAFRNVVPNIPIDTAVDEISIQALVTQLQYRLVYDPEAVVYNRGPTTVGDFLRQRRRIYAGHLRVRSQQGYAASTMSGWRVVRALSGSGSFATPRACLWSLGTVGLEATARALGHYDAVRRESTHVWEISTTTKNQISEGANAHSQQTVVVFHIVNFHRLQLELGLHASRQLTRRAAVRIRRALGPEGLVCIRQHGTIVALLPSERAEAEDVAGELVQTIEQQGLPLGGRGKAPEIKLAYGVIAFTPSGSAVPASAPSPVGDAVTAPFPSYKVA